VTALINRLFSATYVERHPEGGDCHCETITPHASACAWVDEAYARLAHAVTRRFHQLDTSERRVVAEAQTALSAAFDGATESAD